MLSGKEKELSVPLNLELEMQRPHSTTNLSRFRPPPLQQPGGPLTGKGPQSKGVTSPLGKSAEGPLSPFARVQVQSHTCPSVCMRGVWICLIVGCKEEVYIFMAAH